MRFTHSATEVDDAARWTMLRSGINATVAARLVDARRHGLWRRGPGVASGGRVVAYGCGGGRSARPEAAASPGPGEERDLPVHGGGAEPHRPVRPQAVDQQA